MPYLIAMRSVLSFVLVALLLAWPALAGAQATNAPPGLSGVDEYLETVPSAGGAQTPGGGKAGGGSLKDPEVAARADRVVGADTVKRLKAEGDDGERAAALAAAGAPADAQVAGSTLQVALDDSDRSSAAGQIFSVLSGGAGAGVALPMGLCFLTVLLVVCAVRRRRPIS